MADTMSEVLLTRDGPVGVITLAAPERRNALTPQMAQELIDTCDRVNADESIGAVVVRGEGASFCAGGALATLAAVGEDPVGERRYAELT